MIVNAIIFQDDLRIWIYNSVRENPTLQGEDESNSDMPSSLGTPRPLGRGGCHWKFIYFMPSKKNNLPIGVFDSGLGGLTVLRELIRIMPNENYIYLGDTARVPYGTRSDSIIRSFSLQDSAFLVNKKVKCIVIACNTAASIASDDIRKKYGSLPVFDVVGSGSKAIQESDIRKNKTVCIIGTAATIRSNRYKSLIQNNLPGTKVIQKACPLLVPLIEEFEIKSKLTDLAIRKYFANIAWGKVGYLILGCTHYPIIKESIQKYLGVHVRIINPGEYLALDVLDYLKIHHLLSNRTSKGRVLYYITDISDKFSDIASLFLGFSIRNHTYKIKI